MTKHPLLGITETENGTRIDTTVLRMFAAVERSKFERLLDTELDREVREMVEKSVATLDALDAMVSTVLDLSAQLVEAANAPKPTPTQITRTRIVERDAQGLIVATEERDSGDE